MGFFDDVVSNTIGSVVDVVKAPLPTLLNSPIINNPIVNIAAGPMGISNLGTANITGLTPSQAALGTLVGGTLVGGGVAAYTAWGTTGALGALGAEAKLKAAAFAKQQGANLLQGGLPPNGSPAPGSAVNSETVPVAQKNDLLVYGGLAALFVAKIFLV